MSWEPPFISGLASIGLGVWTGITVAGTPTGLGGDGGGCGGACPATGAETEAGGIVAPAPGNGNGCAPGSRGIFGGGMDIGPPIRIGGPPGGKGGIAIPGGKGNGGICPGIMLEI